MKRVTINDVAKVAGVSRQTVSRAMNDKGEISPDTKKRVMAAVRELGYQPNRMAQSMVTRRTRTVGVVLADITNPFFPEVAKGIQDTARSNDYNILLCNSADEEGVEIATLYSLAAQGVDGIILFAHQTTNAELQTFADGFDGPIVVVNRFFKHPKVQMIIVDNLKGAKTAVSHLINQGHTAIGFITNAVEHASQMRRVQGYKETLAEHGLPQPESWIAYTEPTLQGGYEAAKKLLQEHKDLTAVFTYNDLLAIGTMRACKEIGRRVPEDIEIIGFDDILLASMVAPTLSSVHVDKYKLGQTAMKHLLKLIDDKDEPFTTIHIDVELVLRESTKNLGNIA
ncbi:MAG: LacI family DNA-binding transcriptional regulator [Chloroflexota bacterium]